MNYGSLTLALCISFLSLAHADHDETSKVSRPFAAEQKNLFVGATDIHMKELEGPGSLCQSTFVARNPLKSDPKKCRLAFLTAAHCVDSPFDSIDFSGFGEVKASEIKLCRPRAYARNKARFWRSNHSVSGDLATLVFDTQCEKSQEMKPAPLAPVESDGTTALETPHVFLQKRQGAAPGNPGGGKRIQAELQGHEKKLFTFHSPSPQGAAIVGGDSGGPVFDEKGRLVCPMISSSYEYLRLAEKLQEKEPDGKTENKVDPFQVSCDSRAIGKLKEYLSYFGLSSDSTQAVSQERQREDNPECSPR